MERASTQEHRGSNFIVRLFFLMTVACDGPSAQERADEPYDDVLWAGCERVLRAETVPEGEPGTCLLIEPTKLTLWVERADKPELYLGDQLVEVDWRSHEGGWLGDLEVSVDDGALRLGAEGAPGGWRLDLAPNPPYGKVLASLTGRGDAPTAESLASFDALPAEVRASGEGQLARARLLYSAGQYDKAAAVLPEAERVLTAERRPVEALRARVLLADCAIKAGNESARTAQLVEAPPELVPGHFESQIWLLGVRSKFASSTGDVSAQIERIEERAALRRRVRRNEDAEMKELNEAYLNAGHIDTARERRQAALCRLDQTSAEAEVSRIKALTDIAWTELYAVSAGQTPARSYACKVPWAPALSDLVEVNRWVLEAAERAKRPQLREDERANLMLNLALAMVQAGRLDDAEETAGAFLAKGPRIVAYELWSHLILAQVARERAQYALANERYAAVLALAQRKNALKFEVQAMSGLAGVQLDLGDERRALQLASEAMAVADADYALVPALLGGGAFATVLDPVTRVAVEASIRLRDEPRAWAWVRTARTRYLRNLQLGSRLGRLEPAERAEWTKILDEFAALQASRAGLQADAITLAEVEAAPAREREIRTRALRLLNTSLSETEIGEITPREPSPGQLLLGYYRTDAGWLGFAQDASDVTAKRLGPALPQSPEALSELLLAPFAAEIQRAKEVLLIPTGALRDVDVHALPFGPGREPLMVGRPVSYLWDLPAGERSTGAEIVMFADARRDLRVTDEEIAGVRAALPQARVLARADATREAFLGALGEAGVLFFSSHAAFASDVWSTKLVFAEERSVEVGEILVRAGAPGTVVLMACESGVGAAGTGEGLGLAQAFLLAGSDQVIATSRDLDDGVGAAFSVAYASQLAAGRQGAEAWHLAIRDLYGRVPSEDLSALRRLTR